MTKITSLQNPRVKAAVRLRDGRHREKQGRILIDGARELGRAIDGGRAPGRGLRLRAAVHAAPTRGGCCEQLPDCGAEVFEVTEAGVREAAVRPSLGGRAGRGGNAPAHAARDRAARVPAGRRARRRGEAGQRRGRAAQRRRGRRLGPDRGRRRTDLFNPNAIRASLGTIFTMPVWRRHHGDAIDWLRGHGLAVYAARVDGSVPYTEADFRGAGGHRAGQRGRRAHARMVRPDVTAVRLPMLGAADSLNVSATAAVLFYEALRQRS